MGSSHPAQDLNGLANMGFLEISRAEWLTNKHNYGYGIVNHKNARHGSFWTCYTFGGVPTVMGGAPKSSSSHHPLGDNAPRGPERKSESPGSGSVSCGHGSVMGKPARKMGVPRLVARSMVLIENGTSQSKIRMMTGGTPVT